MSRLLSTLATIWRLARPYFWSEDRWAGRTLLAAVIAIELSLVALNVLFNRWNARFYNSLQERDWDTFVAEMLYFCLLAAGFIVLAVYQLYLRQWLQIRWRTWMTRQYLDRWLGGANHYRMQVLGDAADNPDQRIAEDINLFVERGLYIGIKLLGAVVTLVSFVAILWVLSDDAPLTLLGYEIAIPGYLLWAALIYAIIGTALTHLVGAALVGLNFRQQRFEADFRFNLVRARESSEQIALLGGEGAETHRLLHRFASVIMNWKEIMLRTKKLTFLTAGYQQAAVIFPFLVISPAYFAGRIQLGGMMQTVSAFGSVQESLSIIITVYRDLAEWRAVVARLDGFDIAIEQGRSAATAKPAIEVSARPGRNSIEIDELTVRLPQGGALVAADDVEISSGERVLLTGPSGAGKSTLFRAFAGIWPFGSGTVVVPEGSQGDGAAAATLFSDRHAGRGGRRIRASQAPSAPRLLAEAITAVGLPALASRLQEEAHWNRMLSLGEQQRLGIARVILEAPDYLFLDEATASLDEPTEAALYRLLEARLAGTTIVSIGHRSTLAAFHHRGLAMVRDGDRFRVRDAALERAAPMNGRCLSQSTLGKNAERRLAREPPPADRVEPTLGLLQARRRRQIEGALHDDPLVAPVRAETEGIDGREVAGEGRGVIAGKGVAIALVQVGVVVTDIEREHAPGDAETDIPGGVARVGNAVRERRGASRNADLGAEEGIAGSERPIAGLGGYVEPEAIRKSVAGGGELDAAEHVGAIGASIEHVIRVEGAGGKSELLIDRKGAPCIDLPEAHVGLDDVAVDRQVTVGEAVRTEDRGNAAVVALPAGIPVIDGAEVEGERAEGRSDAGREIDLGGRAVRERDARARNAGIELQVLVDVEPRLEIGVHRRPMIGLGDAAEDVVTREPGAESHVPRAGRRRRRCLGDHPKIGGESRRGKRNHGDER